MCKSEKCVVDYCASCALSGLNSCDECFDGYAFNRETGLCEDIRCKKDLCDDCSISGIHSCDVCKVDHYFDLEELECRDLSCKIKQCDKCEANPKKCEQCAKNYWLDKLRN